MEFLLILILSSGISKIALNLVIPAELRIIKSVGRSSNSTYKDFSIIIHGAWP